MARVNFLYRSQKDKANLKVRLQIKRDAETLKKLKAKAKKNDKVVSHFQFEANTEIHTTKEFFTTTRNKKRGLTGNEKNEIKEYYDKIEPIEKFILKRYENDTPKENQKDWLKNVMFDYYNPNELEEKRSDLLTDNIQFIIDNANTRENAQKKLGISKSRINSYKNLLKIINKYQTTTKSKRKLRVKDVNQSFARNFKNWMINQQDYADSYALKKIDDLKTVCKDAEIDNVEVSSQLDKIKGGKISNENIIYLSPEELEKIESLELNSEALKNARKWLILGCSIGQRGGDLLNLTENNINNLNGLEVIQLKQQKTKANVTIPVLEKTAEILHSGFPRKISIQKFNKYIKKLCELAELDEPTKGRKYDKTKKRKVLGTYPKYELVSSHICRRSFATNLYGNMPTTLIMKITAHKTEKMLLQYIGKSDLDYAQQIADFYELQRMKNQKQSVLNVVDNKEAVNQ